MGPCDTYNSFIVPLFQSPQGSFATSLDFNITPKRSDNLRYKITKENGHYIFTVLVACVDENDLEVSVDKQTISVTRAEHKMEGAAVYMSYGFDVESEAKLDIPIKDYELKWRKAESEYKNGILTISIPRLNPAIALLCK